MQTNENIDDGRAFDWGRVSEDYARYRDIYPEEFYQKIVDMGLCVSGQDVLDLGTGTGVLPRALYKHGAHFTGADISERQIEQARRLSSEADMDIRYIVSPAEQLEFPNKSFDVITACQCLMYFNMEVLAPRLHAMLRDNGRFLVLFMAWLPDESEIATGSEALVLKYNPNWTGAGMKRANPGAPAWSKPFFILTNAFSYDISVPFTRESWHGRIKACRGIGASSLSEADIRSFEKEHMEYLRSFPYKFDILHSVIVLDLEKSIHA